MFLTSADEWTIEVDKTIDGKRVQIASITRQVGPVGRRRNRRYWSVRTAKSVEILPDSVQSLRAVKERIRQWGTLCS